MDKNYQEKNIFDFYEIEKKPFAKGVFSEIFHATQKKTGKKFVAKKIKQGTPNFFIENEIKAFQMIKNENIINMEDFFMKKTLEGTYTFFLIFDLINGVDAFNFVDKNSNFLELELVKLIFNQLLNALEACHKKGIVHRDIKLENIMIEKNTHKIKLIDFGLCFITDNMDEKIDSFSGSSKYVPPEFWDRTSHVPLQAELWSLGTVLYALAFSEFPRFDQELAVKCKYVDLKFPPHLGKEYDNIKDLLTKILVYDPKKRMHIKEMKQHPFVNT